MKENVCIFLWTHKKIKKALNSRVSKKLENIRQPKSEKSNEKVLFHTEQSYIFKTGTL